MKTLLVPTNFTDVARHATDYALKLYGDNKLKVILMNSYDQPRTGRSVHVSILDIMKKNSEKGLAEDRLRIEENHSDLDIQIVTKSCQGNLSGAIKSVLQEHQVDLIIMGSKGDMEIMDIFVESATARVIKNISHPMLIVPPVAEFKNIDKIILTTDNKPISSPAVLDQLILLCKAKSCEVKVLNVSKTGNEQMEKTEKMLDEILGDIPHDYSYRKSLDIPMGIYKFIRETDADIVTLVKRKGGGRLVDRFFHQSVSRRIVKRIRQTMLLFTDRNF